MDHEQQSSTKRKKRRSKKAPANYIFALDIGTRSVIGIVGVLKDEKFHVMAVETVEHPKRAMIDGQIEDIEQVSKVAHLVKERLEERLGFQLKRVCVAAAGRALKTQKATYEMTLNESQVIDQELVCRLEAGAIEAAEQQFNPENSSDDQPVFYLVGYSVIEYCLDDYPISNLLDHKGKHMHVEVIATFLPREVVDSLYTTMHKTGLDVASLTLEPIAAMNAAIPQKLRLLNLALVDIGAGTSDIAISKDGGVTAYTMATVAGDEITEAIMKKYLVDFSTAEAIKLQSGQEQDITFQDILGFEHTVPIQEIKNETDPVMCSLCSEISERIVNSNNGVPSAVFLVGGGSKLPGLCSCVAECLSLEPNRVAIGGSNFMTYIAATEADITGPEYATPLGIAISAALNLTNDSFSIMLNGKKAKLFRSSKLTVLDVLLMNGYGYNHLISRSGKSILIELNGKNKTLYGGHSETAKILVNGAEANISTLVNAGDNIQFKPAVAGENAQPSLCDVISFGNPYRIFFDDSEINLATQAIVNGTPALPEQKLHHHDKVVTQRITTLGELDRAFNKTEKALLVNGASVDPEYILVEGDYITYAPTEDHPSSAVTVNTVKAATQAAEPASTVKTDAPAVLPSPASVEAADTPHHPKDVDVSIPSEKILLPSVSEDTPVSGIKNNAPLRITLNNSSVTLEEKPDHTPYLFLDMLNLVDVDPTKPQGNIVLRINGQEAAYMQELTDGDRVDIYWQKDR